MLQPKAMLISIGHIATDSHVDVGGLWISLLPGAMVISMLLPWTMSGSVVILQLWSLFCKCLWSVPQPAAMLMFMSHASAGAILKWIARTAT